MKEMFRSENIIFYQVSESFIDDYLEMLGDRENVRRFISAQMGDMSREDELAWIKRKQESGAPVFSMVEKSSGRYIGNIELMDAEEGALELGIVITPGMQDRGFGKEAIPALIEYGIGRFAPERIVLKVYPFNARAIHVYEECGFREYDRTEEDIFMEYVPVEDQR